MMLGDLVKNLSDLRNKIQYYQPKDCFILGSNNLYTFRKRYLCDVFYIMDECECLRFGLSKQKNAILVTDVASNLIAELPIPEDKIEYFQLNVMYDYGGITFENIIEIINFMKFLEIQHGWKINGI